MANELGDRVGPEVAAEDCMLLNTEGDLSTRKKATFLGFPMARASSSFSR
jgi:hypothetical protein